MHELGPSGPLNGAPSIPAGSHTISSLYAVVISSFSPTVPSNTSQSEFRVSCNVKGIDFFHIP